MAAEYQVAFDLLRSGYDWSPILTGGVFTALSAVAFVLCRRFLGRATKPLSPAWRLGWLWPGAMLLFSVVWTAACFGSTYPDFLEARAALVSGRAPVVQGRIENFAIATTGLRGTESFTVGGVPFHYVSYCTSVGFHLSGEGILAPGQQVRITHWRGAILKLEIARR